MHLQLVFSPTITLLSQIAALNQMKSSDFEVKMALAQRLEGAMQEKAEVCYHFIPTSNFPTPLTSSILFPSFLSHSYAGR